MTPREWLLKHLMNSGVLRTPRVIEAFKAVDRKDFVRDAEAVNVYEDYPLSIGHGQTISQPYTVAFMLELLGAKAGDRVLDIGSGSGWTTALLASIVGESGSVLGLERIGDLVAFGQGNLAKYAFHHAAIRQADNTLGVPGERFERILVSASSASMPEELIDQLKPGGVLVVPVGTSIYRIRKQPDGDVDIDEYPGFVFVPLI